MKSRLHKRSPINRPALPQAGESLRFKLIDVALSDLLLWPLVAIIVGGAAGAAWWRWYLRVPNQPWFLTLVAIPIVAVAIAKVYRGRARVRRLGLGIEGERLVGQTLEAMRAHGYTVFHDIPGDVFNVDHVLIGPAGVFAIETKTASKAIKGDVRIRYDGARVLIDGHTPDRDPIAQAKACADHVRGILANAIQQRFPARPVVLYPGWYVEPQPRGAAVWVLNEKALPSFILHEDFALRPSDVVLLSAALEQFVRSVRGQP